MKNLQIILVGISLLIAAPTTAHAQQQGVESIPLEDIQIFSEVFGRIKSEYVDEVDDSKLLRDAIRGMLSGLDPHSIFLDPQDFEEIRLSTDGKFGGLGIEVSAEDGLIRVVAPMDGTPAYHAGIQPGDLILKLDGVAVKEMSFNEAVDRMRGEPGSSVELTILRENEPEPLKIEVVRAIITMVSVRGGMLEGGFGYARLSTFQSGTAQKLRTKIIELNEKNGGVLNGLVLDLRNNPGGVLNGAVDVSDLFLGEGDIVSTKGRSVVEGQRFSAKPDDIIHNAPLVVLVNGGSASASEIVAGALQDHQRAIIMGTKTFGKGSVQTVIPMSNGSALKITTARYYTPSERSIQAKGIVPDIITEQLIAQTLPKDQQQSVRESDLTGHLKNSDADAENDDSQLSELSAILDSDHQLREALNILKGMALVRNRTKTAG